MKALKILAAGTMISLAILAVRWLVTERPSASVRPPDAQAVVVKEDPSASASPKPLDLGSAVPDAALVDQNGAGFRLSELKGKVVVLAFIYTHCNLASVCPMTTTKLIRAQQLARDRGFHDVQFLLVSFDVERDRPERLREFAERYQPDFSSLAFATGRSQEIARLTQALYTYYRKTPSGQFEHNSVIALLDREGRLRDRLLGAQWTVDQLMASIAQTAGLTNG